MYESSDRLKDSLQQDESEILIGSKPETCRDEIQIVTGQDIVVTGLRRMTQDEDQIEIG
jgi:hypothetical protein